MALDECQSFHHLEALFRTVLDSIGRSYCIGLVVCTIIAPSRWSLALKWSGTVRNAVLVVLFWSLGVSPAVAGGNAGFCEEPNVIIALDHSGSMLEDNKWNQAVNAMNLLAGNFQDSMRIGLMLFPWNGRCSVNRN